MLGIVWAIVTPVMTITIFTFIFAGNLSGTIWDSRYALGLRALSLLRLAALDHVSGHTPTVVDDYRQPRQSVKRVIFPFRNFAGCSSACGAG